MRLTFADAQLPLYGVPPPHAPVRRPGARLNAGAPPGAQCRSGDAHDRASLKAPAAANQAFALAASVGLHAVILGVITQTSPLATSSGQTPATVPQFHVALVPSPDPVPTVEPRPGASTLTAPPAATPIAQPPKFAARPAAQRNTVAPIPVAASPDAAQPGAPRVPATASEPIPVSDASSQAIEERRVGTPTQSASDSAQARPGSSQLARAASGSGAAGSDPLRRAPPAYLHTPEPEYPASAREDGQEGLVVLRVLVSTAGRPVQVQVARPSGVRALDTAAVEAVRKWKFSAATDGRSSIESWMDIPVRFRLE